MDIIHVEVGQLSQGAKKDLKSLQKKFSPDVIEGVKQYFSKRMEFNGVEIEYQKKYVSTYQTMKVIKAGKKIGIDIIPLYDFIRNEIKVTIEQWKDNPPHQPKLRDIITLPESQWLLQMIDYMYRYGLIAD